MTSIDDAVDNLLWGANRIVPLYKKTLKEWRGERE